MELEAEGAFVFGGFGSVGHSFDTIEPGFVDVPFDLDFQGIPVRGFDGGDGFLAFDGITLARDVRRGGEVALEGSGDADLDLVVVAFQHDAGVDGALAVFVFESEGEVGEFLGGPEDGTGFFGAGLAVNGAVLDGPVLDLALGIDPPVGEVFAVEKWFGVGKGGKSKEQWDDAHIGKDTEGWEWIQHKK